MNAFLPKFLDVNIAWAMSHDWPAGQRYDAEAQDTHSLWLFQRGDAHVEMAGREWRLREGMAFLCPPNLRRTIATRHGAQWLSLALRATLFGTTDMLQLMLPPVLWEPNAEHRESLESAMAGFLREWSGAPTYPTVRPDTVDAYIARHYDAGFTQSATSMLLCDSYARTVVGLCWRMLGKVDLEQAAGHSLPAWLGTVLHQLREDPDVAIEKLARDAGISSTQLRRNFQKWFGSSPREYLNRLRLEDARQLLENSDLSVTEIADRIGFLSPPHFNRLFKQVYGLPPAQYRALSRVTANR